MSADIHSNGAGVTRGDDELLAAARKGDADALEALLVRYQPHLYRFGVRMCGNTDDASEVAQESLMAMAKSVRDFRGDASVATWLYTIIRRLCIRKRRRSRFAPAHEESLDAPGSLIVDRLADPTPGPEEAAAGREIGSALMTAIDLLEPGQREVLLLRDVEGLSAPEVAKVLGLGVEAVKSRLHRARLAVRQQVAPLISVPTGPSPLPDCPDVLGLFSRYLEGDIAPEVCAEMESHLERCGHCRGACESLRRTLASCRAMPAAAVPEAVAASVKQAVRAFLARRMD